jgi:hypothetical protein
MYYFDKYIKYKTKYLNLLTELNIDEIDTKYNEIDKNGIKQIGGANISMIYNKQKIVPINIGNKYKINNFEYDFDVFAKNYLDLHTYDKKLYTLVNKYSLLSNERKVYEYSIDTIRYKHKFIYDNISLSLFSVLLVINPEPEKILCVSANYRIIEPVFYYYPKSNVQHLHYDKIYNNDNIKQKDMEAIKKIKNVYKFNDNSLDFELKEKYDLLYLDLIKKGIKFIPDYKEFAKYLNLCENENLFLLENAYKLLDNLEKGGNLIISIFSARNTKTILAIQNIASCFENAYFYKNNMNTYGYNMFVFYSFIEKRVKQTKLDLAFTESFAKYYDDLLNRRNFFISKIEFIKNNINDEKIINSILNENLMYSYRLAKILKFKIYNIKKNINKYLLKSLQKIFSIDVGQHIIIKKHGNVSANIKLEKNNELPNDIKYIIDQIQLSIRQIDFRDIDKYNEVKKFIRFYEDTLNRELIKEGITIDGVKPVSRAWIKFYEILYTTRIFDYSKQNIKAFHLCEAPGTFIMSTLYYLKKWNPSITYSWDATTLNPKFLGKNGIGDTYGLLRKYKDRWTFGADGTGDITKEKNIKHYHELCKERDWIIGDCGLGYTEDPIPGVKLYYAQMLFILYNLKEGGGCIFKQVLNLEYKLLMDMFYILYASFEKVEIYKPVQNEFSPEFFVICSRYKKVLKPNDFDKLFEILQNKDILDISIINNYNKEFTYQIINMLDKIISGFNQAIDRQLYYTDFWDKITTIDKLEINKQIDIKNNDWIEHYLKRK